MKNLGKCFWEMISLENRLDNDLWLGRDWAQTHSAITAESLVKFMIMVHLAKYVLIKVTLAFMLHSLLFVKRSLNQSTAKQRIGKING